MRCWSLVAPHLVEVGAREKVGVCARNGKAETAGEGLVALKTYISPQSCQFWLYSCWGIVYAVSYIVILALRSALLNK